MVYIINSPLFKEKNPLYDEDSLPPIGLGYIATHLRNAGVEVELIDAVDEKIVLIDLIDRLNQDRPEFIASNIFTTNSELVKELVESVNFKTHFIIGGLSTKDLQKEIIDWNSTNQIDIVVGDGELITLDLVQGSLKEEAALELPNRRVFNVFSHSKYFLNDINDVPLNRTFFKNEPVLHPFGFQEANIIASRGCIYNCTFCAAARSLNKDYGIRERSVESLKKELNEIQIQYPSANSIRVLDDLFLKNDKSISIAIDVFSHFKFNWRSMAHVMTFNRADNSILKSLKDSGCKELFIGIESGSPRILNSINKTQNKKVILRNLTRVLKARINIKGYFIYGFPDETLEDMEMTYQLAVELKNVATKYGSNFRTSVFQYRPYHGTAIYHDLLSKNMQTNAERMKADDELSELIGGRIQFNFHTTNHSKVDLSVVRDYIYRTTKLTDFEILSNFRPVTRSKKAKAL